jgi:site-specific DNA-methyltransferase (adenine-specific)
MVTLLQGDCFKLLQEKIEPNSVDLVFADPPYFLSSGGTTCQGGQRVSVDKGDWDKTPSVQEKYNFNYKWIALCKRALKPDGCILISGTYHNMYSVGMCLEEQNFRILNHITWQKTNPPPNLGCRCFTHSTEGIIWASVGGHHTFNYEIIKNLNHGVQMKDVITGPLTPMREKELGKHPTQKPLYLLELLLKACSNEGDTVLDPFCGSGTTGVAAVKLKRNFIGIELDPTYLELTRKRINEVLT